MTTTKDKDKAEQTVIGTETTGKTEAPADDNKALMEELKKEILAEAKAEAKKIIADAKAEAKAEVEKIAADAKKKSEPYHETEEEIARANEKVKIRLFKDKDKYNMDVLVILNGQSYLIQRGVEVEVPRKVADVIACSDAQTGLAADVVSKYKDNYEKKKGQLV